MAFNVWFVADPHGVYKKLRGPGKDIPPRGRSEFPFDAMIAGATLHLRLAHERSRLRTAWNAFNRKHGIGGELICVKADETDPDGPGFLLSVKL